MMPEHVTSETLWSQYLETRETQHRNALVEHYAPLIHGQAARMSHFMNENFGEV